MQNPSIYTHEDVFRMLDALLADRASPWWDEFFSDRAKPIPFFVGWPDENLVTWFGEGLLASGRVLELGCGNGRNAAYLAGRGAAWTLSISRPRLSRGPPRVSAKS